MRSQRTGFTCSLRSRSRRPESNRLFPVPKTGALPFGITSSCIVRALTDRRRQSEHHRARTMAWPPGLESNEALSVFSGALSPEQLPRDCASNLGQAMSMARPASDGSLARNRTAAGASEKRCSPTELRERSSEGWNRTNISSRNRRAHDRCATSEYFRAA